MPIHRCCLFACFNKLVIHTWNILLQVCNSRFQPQLIVYNAGTDILDGDPLGRLKVLLLNPIFRKT
jgi:acetoin utilization deacetylase AcuC-like enzyme